MSVIAMETRNKRHDANREFCKDVNEGNDGEHFGRLVVCVPGWDTSRDILDSSFGLLNEANYQRTKDDDRQDGDDFHYHAINPQQNSRIFGMGFCKLRWFKKITRSVCNSVRNFLNFVERVVCRRCEEYRNSDDCNTYLCPFNCACLGRKCRFHNLNVSENHHCDRQPRGKHVECNEQMEAYHHNIHAYFCVSFLVVWWHNHKETNDVDLEHQQTERICNGQGGKYEVGGLLRLLQIPDNQTYKVTHNSSHTNNGADITMVTSVNKCRISHSMVENEKYIARLNRIHCHWF